MRTILRRVLVTAAAASALAIADVSAATRPASAGEDLKGLRAPDGNARAAALREIVKRSREELKDDAPALRAALRRALTKDDAPEVRGLAAAALLHVEGDAAIPAVLDAMRVERDPDAERLLALAWAEISTDAARKALVEATCDASDVRCAALTGEALGSLPAGLGADDLIMLADGALPWAAQAGVCLGLRGVKQARSIQMLVARTSHPDAAVRSAARESLVWLTAQDQGSNPRNWESWWEKAREGFRFPDGPGVRPEVPRPAGSGADSKSTTDRADVASQPTWAEFFGLPIRGARVAFVIDYSQSMWGQRREKAEKELLDAVKSLPGTARVTVILFNERVWTFRKSPVPARPQEKFDLASLLPQLETKSYTNLYDAVETALGLLGDSVAGAGAPGGATPAPGVDDVVVLTDGVPNRGKWKDADRICAGLRERNAGRARISCVALAEEGADLLRRIAKENGGAFVSFPFAK